MARRIASCVWLLVTLCLPLQIQPVHAAHKWEGIYDVTGTNEDGSAYAGFVQVTPIPQTELYRLVWALSNGGMSGLGYEDDGILIVIGSEVPMLASFRKNGKGRWLTQGFRKPGTEHWSRSALKELPKAPAPEARPSAPPPSRRMPHRGPTEASI